MILNPWNAPNEATRRLAGRCASYAEAVRRGVIRVPILRTTDLHFAGERLEPFQISKNQQTAAPTNSVFNWIIDQDFDQGSAGLITGIFHDYPMPPGAAFVDGNQFSLYWTLAIDWRYVPNYAVMATRLGSRQQFFEIPGIPVFPGQNIKYGYAVPAASGITTGGQTVVQAGIKGYKFPATKMTT